MDKVRRSRCAFTLIELLVVVAIIALLLAILLPALNRAKEQGRVAVCLANLRSIVQSGAQYQLDNQDDLPWVLPANYYAGAYRVLPPGVGISETVWGGTMPDKRPGEWAQTGLPGADPLNFDIYVAPARFRPLNKYISPTVSWDRPERDRGAPRVNIPNEVPGFFKCPSDSTALLPEVGQPNQDLEGDTAYTTWSWWGTSYPINWYWPYYFAGRTPVGQGAAPAPYNGDFVASIGYYSNTGVRGLGREMLKDKGGRWATEFITFYENRLNYALAEALPRGVNNTLAKRYTGWHRQPDLHAAGFLDGSARYQRYDTRYVDGPGWTTWPNRPWKGGWQTYENN